MKHLFFITIIFFSFNFLFSEIIPIQTFEEVFDDLRLLEQDSLVIFDVDDVLITSQDMYLRPCGAKFRPQCIKGMDPQERLHLISVMLDESSSMLVDPSIISLLESLKSKGIKTIALTAARTGKFGVIKNCENWRIEKLKQFNIDFSESFPDWGFIDFNGSNFSGQDYPLFKDGILFLGDDEKITKGELLVRFFTSTKWRPKKVIFFDDKLHHIVSLQTSLDQLSIEFKGYHFKRIESLSGKFNEEIAEMQFLHLIKTQNWLSDSEAAKINALELQKIQ